jgi:hypothetical protein
MQCECKPPESWKGPTANVFLNVVVIDYYDGPFSAVCKCSTCGSAKLLNVISWKPGRSFLRIFGVASITLESLNQITQELLAQQRRIAAGNSDLKDEYEVMLSSLRSGAAVEAVLAATNIETEIIAARQVHGRTLTFANPFLEVSGETYDEWLAYLGIAEQ